MIKINGFGDVEVDGVSVGDCFAARTNYPKISFEILQALIAYDTQRQGEADDKAAALAIEQAQKSAEPLHQKITELEGTIAHLTARLQQLAPNLAAILPELLQAGLTAWSERSIAAYHPGEDTVSIVPEIAKLFALAEANQVAEVRQVFVSIVLQTKIAPTPEESAQLQSVLDSVRFPVEILEFNYDNLQALLEYHRSNSVAGSTS